MITKVGNNVFDSDKIEAATPKEEPARQYYFIGIAREMLKAQFEADVSSGEAQRRYGKETLDAMLADEVYGTFKVVTFGCRLNIMEGIV